MLKIVLITTIESVSLEKTVPGERVRNKLRENDEIITSNNQDKFEEKKKPETKPGPKDPRAMYTLPPTLLKKLER